MLDYSEIQELREIREFSERRFSGISDAGLGSVTPQTSKKLQSLYNKMTPLMNIQAILHHCLRGFKIYKSIEAGAIVSFMEVKNLLKASLERLFNYVRSQGRSYLDDFKILDQGELGENFPAPPFFSDDEKNFIRNALAKIGPKSSNDEKDKAYDKALWHYRRYLSRIANEGEYKNYFEKAREYVDDIVMMKKETAKMVANYYVNYANFIFKVDIRKILIGNEELGHVYWNYLDKISWTVREVVEEFVAKKEVPGLVLFYILSNDPETHLVMLSHDITGSFKDNYSAWKMWVLKYFSDPEDVLPDARLLELLGDWNSSKRFDAENKMEKQISEEMREYENDLQYKRDRKKNLRFWNQQLEDIKEAYNDDAISIERLEEFLEDVLQEGFEKKTWENADEDEDEDFINNGAMDYEYYDDLLPKDINEEINNFLSERQTDYVDEDFDGTDNDYDQDEKYRMTLNAYYEQMKDAIQEMENLFGKDDIVDRNDLMYADFS